MPSLFDSLNLKGTLQTALKGAVSGAKVAAVKKLSSSGDVQRMATEMVKQEAASAAGGKLLDIWSKHKTKIIAGGAAVLIGIPVLLFMAFRKRK